MSGTMTFAERRARAMKFGRRVPMELLTRPRWYACYTMARREKRVEALLRRRGARSYLPLIPRERQWHDRKKIVEWPLFPGYVFAHFALDELDDILSTPGVATVVRMDGTPAPIRDEEVANVKRFAAALAETGGEPEPEPLPGEGRRVRIVRGPFEAVEGVVLEQRGRRRVLVGLDTIGTGFEVDVAASALELLDDAAEVAATAC